ncbi:hypothetical protein [Winogradskyella sp. SYSU M77433]|uniref:hypothetical protein n=1 Tax=Winogradskyella sp. SYSU M77433 TaxID=3042722 RepID=UPI0024817DC1|nr:hypothetical protein [Winogradskyella sp. SYSU M77433]MDH7911364.1 hypothetical protein [Winogradskyella sp. SYSU M77433]
MKPIKITITSLLISSFLFFSCNSLKTAVYDQYSYQKTVEIKVEASNLIDKATTPYEDNLQEVGELGLEIQKIIEYEKNKPNNEITYAMWQVLADKDKNLLVGFFKRWKEKGQLNSFFVEEAKVQIMQAMDLLLEYEIKKDKETEDKLLQLITQ